MFALFSDSREGSWRHAATLLATVAGKPGNPRLNRSSATNFLSFSLKLKENSKVGIITKPFQLLQNDGGMSIVRLYNSYAENPGLLKRCCRFCRLRCLLSRSARQVSPIMFYVTTCSYRLCISVQCLCHSLIAAPENPLPQ